MKTTSYPTSHILIKASTNSVWDECSFAIIDCTDEWKQQLKDYHVRVKLFINDDFQS